MVKFVRDNNIALLTTIYISVILLETSITTTTMAHNTKTNLCFKKIITSLKQTLFQNMFTMNYFINKRFFYQNAMTERLKVYKLLKDSEAILNRKKEQEVKLKDHSKVSRTLPGEIAQVSFSLFFFVNLSFQYLRLIKSFNILANKIFFERFMYLFTGVYLNISSRFYWVYVVVIKIRVILLYNIT